MEANLLAAILSLTLAATAAPESAPSVTAADRTSIAEARTIAGIVGDSLWPGWSKTPFTIDLLTSDFEIIQNSSIVPTGFTQDPGTKLAYRKRVFPSQLEATFPAFGNGPVIVIGEQPLTAAKTPTRWSVTLMHEHFHQWQNTWPAYYPSVKKLGLAHGDATGMWMLNYPFPYDAPATGAAYAKLTAALTAAVRAIGTARFDAAFARYLAARSAWQASLKSDDYKYFAFQCWQEGVARYTEYRVASIAASAEDSGLLAADATRTRHVVLNQLSTIPLATGRRNLFYAVGAAEALLLDRVSPGWQKRYLDPRFDLSALMRNPS